MATTDKRAVVGYAHIERKNGEWNVTLNDKFIGTSHSLGDVSELIYPHGKVWAFRRVNPTNDSPHFIATVYKRKNNV